MKEDEIDGLCIRSYTRLHARSNTRSHKPRSCNYGVTKS